jgi:hypothetical protein
VKRWGRVRTEIVAAAEYLDIQRRDVVGAPVRCGGDLHLLVTVRAQEVIGVANTVHWITT